MRIGMFTDTYKPQINGVVVSIDSFSKRLREENVVKIFAPSSPGYADSDRWVYRLTSIPFRSYKDYRLSIPVNLLTTHRDNCKDLEIVHVHSPFSLGTLGLEVARHYNIPKVGTFHTLYPEYTHYFVKSERLMKIQKIDSIARKITWKYIRWFYNRCDHVISPSERIKTVMEKNGITKPITVIPTGIDFRKRIDKNEARQKLGMKTEDRIILHVGRVTKEKKIDVVLKSLAEILKGDTKLVVTSDGPYMDEIKSLAKKLEANVVFTGFISEEKLRLYYSAADVFVSASDTETQGITLLEAASAGTPIVAVRSPVVSDFIEETSTGISCSRMGLAAAVLKAMEERKFPRGKYRESEQRVAKGDNLAGDISVGDNSLRPAGTEAAPPAKGLEKYDMKRCAKQLENVYNHVIRMHKEHGN